MGNNYDFYILLHLKSLRKVITIDSNGSIRISSDIGYNITRDSDLVDLNAAIQLYKKETILSKYQ